MLPYLPPPAFQFGQVTVHIFGIMAVIGILSMILVGKRQVVRRGMDQQIGWDIFFIGVGVGLPSAHVFSVLWGAPHQLMENPMMLLQLNHGIDSFGGFLGFAIGLFVYRQVNQLQGRLLTYLDCTFYGFCFGWIICRLGCAWSHDHPGIPSHSLLAIDYPVSVFGGVPRHNLGLEEALGVAVIFLILTFLNRKPRPDGFIFAAMLILYSPLRFFLDFLRASDLPFSDARYGHLTPAQWGCVILLLMGIYIIARGPFRYEPAQQALNA